MAINKLEIDASHTSRTRDRWKYGSLGLILGENPLSSKGEPRRAQAFIRFYPSVHERVPSLWNPRPQCVYRVATSTALSHRCV